MELEVLGQRRKKSFPFCRKSCKINTKETCRAYTDNEVVNVAGYIILGTLAAIGLMSVVWVFLGALLPGGRGGAFVCLDPPEEGLLARYRWLRDVGLVNGPILIVSEEDLPVFGRGIEVCRREELIARLERERVEEDAAGNGDSPGRSQRRGISEL